MAEQEKCAGVLCCPECEKPLAITCPNGHADAADRAWVRDFHAPRERAKRERREAVQPECAAGCGARRPRVRGRIPKSWTWGGGQASHVGTAA